MKKFLNENWFKLGILIVLFILAGTFAYFLGYKNGSEFTETRIQNHSQTVSTEVAGQTISQREATMCTETYGPHAYLRDASTGYCGCTTGYTAMYIQGQGEQCVDPSNVLLIPPKIKQ